MNRKIKSLLLSVLSFSVLSTSTIQTFAASTGGIVGEFRQGEILAMGSSLTKAEESSLRDYFGVSDELEAIYVDNATAIKQFGLADDALDSFTGGWYSSAYVKITSKGGITVDSKNLNLVTNEMFANALLTSGIVNATVNVSAPFVVTGESALAGILAGAEQIMGEELSEENKAVAKEEIDTTLDLADEILKENDEITEVKDASNVASGIINDIKQQVIKDSPNSTQIQQIIINVSNNYNVELSKEAQTRVLNLMEDVKGLDIEYKDIKQTMKNISDSISQNLKDAGLKFKESGFFERITTWFTDLFENFKTWLSNLFNSVKEEVAQEDETEEDDSVTTPDEKENDQVVAPLPGDEIIPEGDEPTTEVVEGVTPEEEVVEDVVEGNN